MAIDMRSGVPSPGGLSLDTQEEPYAQRREGLDRISSSGSWVEDVSSFANALRRRSLFITGASGFIGRALLDRLARSAFGPVTCLSRQPEQLAPHLPVGPGWRAVGGDLDDPSSYAEAVGDADTVVHLAAATGNASDSELERVNLRGTRRLLEECERRQVSRILFVSSIAARYPDLERYPYGRTKRDGEELVRSTRLDFTILRPTIVLGEGSPIWRKLRNLATLPVIPVFGDGSARVQPIAVEDVTAGIAAELEHGRFAGGTTELGGPEVLTFGAFLLRIRQACGCRGTRQLRLPLRPAQALLGTAGKLLGGALPVSAGQLSPFVNDGIAGPSDLYDRLRPSMQPLDVLLQRLARMV